LKQSINHTDIYTLLKEKGYSEEEKQIISMYFLEGINVSRISIITAKNAAFVKNFVQRVHLQILQLQQTDEYKKAVEILYR
jgi:hypothetical protein